MLGVQWSSKEVGGGCVRSHHHAVALARCGRENDKLLKRKDELLRENEHELREKARAIIKLKRVNKRLRRESERQAPVAAAVSSSRASADTATTTSSGGGAGRLTRPGCPLDKTKRSGSGTP